MANVVIDNLVTGMVVSSDVHDRSGRLLLSAGIKLNDKHLRMFRTWGVVEVDIADGDARKTIQPIAREIDTQRLQALETELKPLFRNTNLAHPAMEELFRLCLLRKALHAAD